MYQATSQKRAKKFLAGSILFTVCGLAACGLEHPAPVEPQPAPVAAAFNPAALTGKWRSLTPSIKNGRTYVLTLTFPPLASPVNPPQNVPLPANIPADPYAHPVPVTTPDTVYSELSATHTCTKLERPEETATVKSKIRITGLEIHILTPSKVTEGECSVSLGDGSLTYTIKSPTELSLTYPQNGFVQDFVRIPE